MWQFWLIYNNFVGSKSFPTKLGLKIILNYQYWANEIGTYFDIKMSDNDTTFADMIDMSSLNFTISQFFKHVTILKELLKEG